jgi:hypothetical protein
MGTVKTGPNVIENFPKGLLLKFRIKKGHQPRAVGYYSIYFKNKKIAYQYPKMAHTL